jgi:hypothetical protein
MSWVRPGSGSCFFTHPGSRGQKGTGSRIRIRNTARMEWPAVPKCQPDSLRFDRFRNCRRVRFRTAFVPIRILPFPNQADHVIFYKLYLQFVV